MHLYSWLIRFAMLATNSHAWPELPHFELQQASNANAASAQISTQAACKRMAVLTKLSNIAANKKSFDAMLKDRMITQDQVDYIETRRVIINSELQELSMNTTLMIECGIINAHQNAVEDCKKLNQLEKLVGLTNSKIPYDTYRVGEILNQKQTEQLKKNMENAEIKLQELHRNSTLIELCTRWIDSQQNRVDEQQAGSIGEAAVDDSGAIGLSTSNATIICSNKAMLSAIAFGTFVTFAFL